jgi:prepilin-type N-terminal cleavage/methylation domain-containing protein
MSRKLLNQKGMTLVELLIALAIASFVVAAAALVIFQLLTTPERNSDYMTAYTQVQNAGFNVSRDAVQAEAVSVTDDPETPEIEILTLDWIDWQDNTHQVVYTLKDASDGLKELWRDYSIRDSNGVLIKNETLVVAQYIDSGTYCSWDDDNDPETPNVLTLEVTAQVGDKTATRTYNVEPRPYS